MQDALGGGGWGGGDCNIAFLEQKYSALEYNLFGKETALEVG